MKIYNYLILFTIFITKNLSGQNQDCWNVVNTQTTDWRESNSSNTFDWTQEYYEMYISGYPISPKPIRSPFWDFNSTSVNSVLLPFHEFIDPSNKDFHPEDGWELVAKNFGTPQQSVDYPFFVLYNKYTGLMRNFAMIPDRYLQTIQGSVVKMSFTGSRRSALFQHLKTIGRDVVNFEPDLNADFFNEYHQINEFWFLNEFVTAYDPCTCFDFSPYDQNGNAHLTANYSWHTENVIDLYMAGTITNQPITLNGSVNSNPGYSLFGIDNINKLGEVAQKNYKNWGAYSSFLIKSLDDYTDPIYRERLWQSINDMKSIDESLWLKLMQNAFTTSQQNVNYSDFMAGNFHLKPEYFGIYSDLFGQHASTFKTIASSVPYVGTALSVLNLISKGGKKGKFPISLQSHGPSVSLIDANIFGKMTSVTSIGSHIYYLPGFSFGLNPNYSTIYDNILGIFNILELPDFEFYEIFPDVTNKSKIDLANHDPAFYHTGNQCKINFSEFNDEGAEEIVFRQYKPKSSLKYVVNPASNLEVVSVEATIILSYNAEDTLFLEKPQDISIRKAIPFYPLISTPDSNKLMYQIGLGSGFPFPSSDINGVSYAHPTTFVENGNRIVRKEFQTERAIEKRIENIEANTNLILDHITKDFPDNNLNITNVPKVKFRTSYLPVTCFDKLNFTVLGSDNLPEIYTKVYVVLKRKDDPEAELVNLTFNYSLENKIQNATKSPEIGNYASEIIADHYNLTDRCCFKCGTDLTFRSVEFLGYHYSQKPFKMLHLPKSKEWFNERNRVYNGESNLTVIGALEIPENSIIPANSLIKAGGEITIGQNVTIGPGTEIYSAVAIEAVNNNVFFPNVKLAIAPLNSIINDCDNYDYELNHLGDDEIITKCTSPNYKNNALYSSPNVDTSFRTKNNILKEIDFNVFPNPTNDKININFLLNNEIKKLDMKLIDITGQILQMYSLTVEELKSSTFILNVNDLTGGIYFIHVETEGYRKVKKFVKI